MYVLSVGKGFTLAYPLLMRANARRRGNGGATGPAVSFVAMTGGGSSIPAVQDLLATLVAAKPGGRIAELGTAFGAGTKAMLRGLADSSSLVTVEADAERYRIACWELRDTRAEVILGDWREELPARAPFDLIFLDAGDAAAFAPLAIEMLAEGGLLVKDDLSPGRQMAGDPTREALLADPRLVAVEIQTTPDTAAIIAVRRSGTQEWPSAQRS